jgi:hypothetical protein
MNASDLPRLGGPPRFTVEAFAAAPVLAPVAPGLAELATQTSRSGQLDSELRSNLPIIAWIGKAFPDRIPLQPGAFR